MTPAPARDFGKSSPVPSVRRGECPTLQKPMQTGDGLLARLRPLDAALTPAQVKALAAAAADRGNGILEVTARGSLQARGLKPETVAPFEAAVLAAGVSIPAGVGVETPPLAGLDPDELIDVRPLAAELRQRIAGHRPALVLAPKLAITIDGGGRFHLGGVSADLKVTAFRDSADRVKFLLAVGGDGSSARAVAAVDREALADAVLVVLQTLSDIGPAARGKDIDVFALEALRAGRGLPQKPVIAPAPSVGLHDLGAHSHALGIAFAYCQADASSLIAFADAAIAAGADNIRLAPDHCLFVTGLAEKAAADLQRKAATLGFWTEPKDPRRSISLCAGSRGCASAFFDTRSLAEKFQVQAPDLLDGSFDIHLSGCAKGCAHPAPALLAFSGARAGYGLVVNGTAGAAPTVYIAENDIETALRRLQVLVRQSKESGESVARCLARLGGDRIASALQTDRT